MDCLVEVGLCHGMAAHVGGLGFVLVSCLDAKDWFSKPVTQFNSAATRAYGSSPG